MDSVIFFTSEDLSKGIVTFAEKTEELKDLYYTYQKNPSQVDETTVMQLETTIANFKWNIISYLSNEDSYREWLHSSNNNGLLLFKYFKKGHFLTEIGPNEQLKNQIIKDFEEQYQHTNPSEIIVHEDRIRQRQNENLSISEEDAYKYEEEDKLAVKVSHHAKAFQKEFNHTFMNINYSRLNNQVNNVLSMIKNNPALLKNSPHHYVVNPKYSEATVNTSQLRRLIELASLKDDTALQHFIMLEKSFHNIDAKSPHKKLIQGFRNENKLSQGLSNTAPKLN